MIIKLCGLKTKNNVKDLQHVRVDMVGLNFYESSVRYVPDDDLTTQRMDTIPAHIKKVGIFVDASLEEIQWRMASFNLDVVQLHGSETVEFCKQIAADIPVWKAFGISEHFDFGILAGYASYCEYFVFDTASTVHGGSGQSFDWEVLKGYTGNVPFLLSGGIGPDDAEKVLAFKHPAFAGIDINSRFEFAPSNKDMGKVYDFVESIRKDQLS